MKAVPFNKRGIAWDEAMCADEDVLDATAESTFKELYAKWIDTQAGGEELGGEGGDGTWTFDFGDDGKETMSGKKLEKFILEQLPALPVGFWILEDLHYKAACVPLEDTAEHGGHTIHEVAAISFMHICALLAVKVVGNTKPAGVVKS